MVDVVVVDDDPDFARRVGNALARSGNARMVANPGTVHDALKVLEGITPDVLLVDIGLPDASGIEVIRHAAGRFPDCDILVITVFGDPQSVLAALEAGATGYLLKNDVNKDYVAHIEDLRSGGSPMSPTIARQLLRKFQQVLQSEGATEDAEEAGGISDRQKEVLGLLSRGYTYREIAGLLGVSEHTIGTYCKRVYRRLQVTSRSEAVFEARKLGLLR